MTRRVFPLRLKVRSTHACLVGASVAGALSRSKPPIDPEQTRNPASEESPEAFILVSGPTWATGDEPCLLLIGHGDEGSRLRIRPNHETADSRPHCGRGPAIRSDYPAGVSRRLGNSLAR